MEPPGSPGCENLTRGLAIWDYRAALVSSGSLAMQVIAQPGGLLSTSQNHKASHRQAPGRHPMSVSLSRHSLYVHALHVGCGWFRFLVWHVIHHVNVSIFPQSLPQERTCNLMKTDAGLDLTGRFNELDEWPETKRKLFFFPFSFANSIKVEKKKKKEDKRKRWMIKRKKGK